MNKKQIIKSVSTDILLEQNLKRDMSDMDIFLIVKKITELEHKNNIERSIKQRCIAILRGILKMKRYGWIPHKSFIDLLKVIGFYNLTNDK